MTTAAALDLVLTLLKQATRVGAMITQARAAGRDSLNEEELDELLADNDQARLDLQASIDEARAAGR